MTANSSAPGCVYLVGAGPGDPKLLTVRGLELLRQADVVVFDALANPVLLQEAPTQAERIDVGKRAKAHKMTQDEINALLVEKARQGHRVVRLKGGDPYLFGRGAEEAIYLAQAGIPCQVVPGVTSGIAAPAMAGIPVSHRGFASTVTFVTGHENPDKPETAIDYASLAGLIRSGGTACFYMGVGRLESIASALQQHGLSPDTPAALVQWGTLPKQKSVRTTLASATADVAAAGIGSPAIIVVGPVAAIAEPGLDWFTRRPLFSRTILITRTRAQASELREKLEELGAQVLEAPTIRTEPAEPDVMDRVDEEIQEIKEYQWLVLTSPNGVEKLAERLEALKLDARHLAGLKIAVVGEGTDQALRQKLGLHADLVPTRFVAESLAGELIAQQDIRAQKILLLRADIARPSLPKKLQEAGAEVTELAIYRTLRADDLPAEILQALRNKQVHWITFTSTSTADNLMALLGDEKHLLQHVRLASIGPITTAALRKLDLQPTVEAAAANLDSLAQAILAAESPAH
ncbi:MAG: uroporphyrinogen-III C-methyltransferase [Phycisphaeraceae bacterium]|nr:uroporphyrinogen-III C-methyltransferase [Phycisphaeraceae bacterium]